MWIWDDHYIAIWEKDCVDNKNNTKKYVNDLDDRLDLRIVSHEISQELRLPEGRQHIDYQLLLLHNVLNTKVSIDKISKFSIFPLELLKVIDQIGY